MRHHPKKDDPARLGKVYQHTARKNLFQLNELWFPGGETTIGRKSGIGGQKNAVPAHFSGSQKAKRAGRFPVPPLPNAGN